MTVRAPLALAKPIAAGEGVSYGHTWVADEDDDRRPGAGRVRRRRARATAATALEVAVDGVRRPVRGRVCMDQFVVDLGGDLPPRRRRRSSSSARATTASPPRRTGPTRAGRSPTRSSPGSAAAVRRHVDEAHEEARR